MERLASILPLGESSQAHCWQDAQDRMCNLFDIPPQTTPFSNLNRSVAATQT